MPLKLSFIQIHVCLLLKKILSSKFSLQKQIPMISFFLREDDL